MGFNMIFGRRSGDSLSSIHPNAVQSFNLWQIYLSNVHPLTKLLHAPTVQQVILETASNPLGTAPVTEALVFAIYLAAVVSMRDEECLEVLGTSKDKALFRFCHATEEALSNMEFLKSTELEVLQAFVLYLVRSCETCLVTLFTSDLKPAFHSPLLRPAFSVAIDRPLQPHGTEAGTASRNFAPESVAVRGRNTKAGMVADNNHRWPRRPAQRCYEGSGDAILLGHQDSVERSRQLLGSIHDVCTDRAPCSHGYGVLQCPV